MKLDLSTVFNLTMGTYLNYLRTCYPYTKITFQNKINQLQTWINNFSGNPNSQQLANKQCKLDIFTAMLPWAQDEWNQPGSMNGC